MYAWRLIFSSNCFPYKLSFRNLLLVCFPTFIFCFSLIANLNLTKNTSIFASEFILLCLQYFCSNHNEKKTALDWIMIDMTCCFYISRRNCSWNVLTLSHWIRQGNIFWTHITEKWLLTFIEIRTRNYHCKWKHNRWMVAKWLINVLLEVLF